jgi:hypothetical protein
MWETIMNLNWTNIFLGTLVFQSFVRDFVKEREEIHIEKGITTHLNEQNEINEHLKNIKKTLWNIDENTRP